MEEKGFIISEEEKKELESLLSLDFSEEKSVKFLGNVFLNAERIVYLSGFVCNRLEHYDDFIQNAEISPLLGIIDKLPRIKAKLLWDLLYWKLLHTKNKEEIEIFLRKLEKCKDPYLRIYLIRRFNREDVISKEKLKKSLNFDEPLELLDFSAKNTRDLINTVVTFIESSDNKPPQLYEELKNIFSEIDSTSEDSIHYNQLTEFLARLLRFTGFTNCDTLVKLFTDFYKVEEQLIVSYNVHGKRDHRDHFLHSLNVFLLGMIFLLIDWEIKGSFNPVNLASWVLTSFFHDIGYGIEKSKQTSQALENHAGAFVEMEHTKVYPKQSFNYLMYDTIKEIEEMLAQHQGEEYHTAHILMPILESLDDKKHGIMSAVMVRKEIDQMMSKDKQFQLFLSPLWKVIYLRSAIAMTLHTCIEEFSNGLVVDEWHPPRADEVSDLLFPTFLLVLIDTMEFVNRPRFRGFYSGNNILDFDIKLNIGFNISYDFERFTKVDITLEYKNREKLSERFNDFVRKLSNFYSENWGVTITFRESLKKEKKEEEEVEDREIKLFLLKNEWKEFEEYMQKNEINFKETKFSEIRELHKSFFEEITKKHSMNISETEYKMIQERKTSYQIERDFYKKFRQFW